MSLTLGYLIATLAAQAGSACLNCKRSVKQAKELARKQQAFEERILREGIENSRQEFAEICALQYEIEQQMQHNRVQLIRDNHHTSLMLEAYRHSLANWPLFVPPFVIKNKCLPLLETIQQEQTETIAVNCILTPSMDSSFNLKVFPLLEERLAQFFSKFWATNSNQAIRFYQQAWRNNITDVGSMMHDLKAHLSEVPSIVLSPVIEDNKLLFTFSWWGFSDKAEDEHILELNNTYNPELSIDVKPRMDYSKEIIATLLNEITSKLGAFISYFADLYYWNYYHLTPKLPILLHSGKLELSNKSEYSNQYSDLLRAFLNGSEIVDNLSGIWKGFAPMINNSSLFIDGMLDYIQRIPENYRIEQENILSVLGEEPITPSQKLKIESLKSGITSSLKKQNANGLNFKILKYKSLNLKEVIEIMLPIGRLLPRHDSFNIIVNKEKLYALVFFSFGDEIVTWENHGIYIFQSQSLIVPDKIFNENFSTFSCPSNQLEDFLKLLEHIMTKKEILELLDTRYNQLKQNLIPVSTQLEDVFAEFVSQLKSDLAKEFKNCETEQFNRKELKYEDIVKWLRQAREAMGKQPFNGAFLTRQKAGLFDKYPCKLYICLTRDKQPLVEANHPKGIFCYEKTDDSIDDMFANKEIVQLNFT